MQPDRHDVGEPSEARPDGLRSGGELSPRGEVMTALNGLPWQQRFAVTGAVGAGRAVEDRALARLAADYAGATHRQLVRIYLAVLLPLGVAVIAGVLWWTGDRGYGVSVAAAIFAGALTLSVMGVMLWAVTLRPLSRARQANLHAAGLVETAPSKRDISNWVIAWLIAWPVAAVMAAVLHAADLDAPAWLTLPAWLGFLLLVKRALDGRRAE